VQYVPEQQRFRKSSKQQDPELRRLLEPLLEALTSDQPAVRAAVVHQLQTQALPGVRREVLSRLVSRCQATTGAARDSVLAVLRALGLEAIEHLKGELLRTRAATVRVNLVELLGTLCQPRDGLVFLLLHDLIQSARESTAVQAAAQAILQRIWPRPQDPEVLQSVEPRRQRPLRCGLQKPALAAEG